MASDSNGEFLFVVDYDSDAERKRVEYLFDNAEGEVSTLSGLSRIAEGVDLEEMYEQLVSKVPEEQVRAYRLEPVDVTAEPERTTVTERVSAPAETVEPFVEYMLSKKKAVLQSAAHNEYEVYTKKGRADISYALEEDGGETAVEIQVEGYPPAPAFLGEYFERELSDYAKSQQP
ncbi:hypothetical protein [Halorhabdus amylolytica]|uniref:hypothetical protein n=1 Tax=Halorhabdus amylolytica TaxID=2559573 RepID=UPI0010AA709E|nr:hypothetical protein [Halorhabdus amylolytica]